MNWRAVALSMCFVAVFAFGGWGTSEYLWRHNPPIVATTHAYMLMSDGRWCNVQQRDCMTEITWLWGAQQPAVAVKTLLPIRR